MRRKPHSRVWGRHSTSFPRGAKPQNCGFWHRGRNLLSVTANFSHFRPPLFWKTATTKVCFSFSATTNPVKAFLPAFAKMTPDAVVSTRCWRNPFSLPSTTVNAPNAKHQAEKFPPRLLLQPAGGKMAGSGAGQQKSSKSFSRLTAFAGRVGGGWYSVFMTCPVVRQAGTELTVN